jgi:hypothetical protein
MSVQQTTTTNFLIAQGSTFSHKFVDTNDDGTPFNLTGC